MGHRYSYLYEFFQIPCVVFARIVSREVCGGHICHGFRIDPHYLKVDELRPVARRIQEGSDLSLVLLILRQRLWGHFVIK